MRFHAKHFYAERSRSTIKFLPLFEDQNPSQNDLCKNILDVKERMTYPPDLTLSLN